VDRVSVYLLPEVTLPLLPEIARLNPREVWLNPGAEDSTLVARAQALGLTVVEACSIVDANLRPVFRN
jgi:predicted CoA-binding protein